MDAVNATKAALPQGIGQIAIPVPYLGTVNVWLLEGDPLTLVDTGPTSSGSLEALDQALHSLDVALDEIELILLTHHHLDHSGLAASIAERSGAAVASTAGTADWGAAYEERAALERGFGRRLLSAHGVPTALIESSEPFWEHIVRNGARFATTNVLTDGDLIRAGDRSLRVIERPGHSVTDTLFVDEANGVALVGDHLLAEITSGTEVVPADPARQDRRCALAQYLEALRLTADLPLELLLTGHGPVIRDHRRLIAERLAFHEERLGHVAALVDDGGTTAFDVARRIWGSETAETQAVLVIWEVVAHLDVLAQRGLVSEATRNDGIHVFRRTTTLAPTAAIGI
jgi:glyoxylase-like metal-dependent hydrolase (beta-lactamase superfamily II)